MTQWMAVSVNHFVPVWNISSTHKWIAVKLGLSCWVWWFSSATWDKHFYFHQNMNYWMDKFSFDCLSWGITNKSEFSLIQCNISTCTWWIDTSYCKDMYVTFPNHHWVVPSSHQCRWHPVRAATVATWTWSLTSFPPVNTYIYFQARNPPDFEVLGKNVLLSHFCIFRDI